MGLREQGRREKLQKTIRDAGLDGYLIVDPVNVSYLTGFNGDDSYLWIGDAGAIILSDTRFEEQIKEESPDVGAAIRCSGQSTLGLLESAITDKAYSSARPKKVGLEAQATSVATLRALESRFPDVEFVARSNDVETLRRVKDEGEVAEIRGAIQVSIDAYRAIRRDLPPSATEADLRDELEYRMRRLGGDDVAFPSIVAFDARAALPHAIPGRRGTVEESSLILIDWGAKRNYYVGDLTRAFLTPRGESSSEFRARYEEVFRIVREAHDKAIEAIRPGALGVDIDQIARDHIRKSGYGDYFGHGLGHGIGRVVHDFGGFSPSSNDVLAPNMILTVEPGIYLPGWGGVRLEDDVLVTESGCEILSSNLGATE